MTCRDDVGTTDPDKSESKIFLVVPNSFLGSETQFCTRHNNFIWHFNILFQIN